MHCISVYSWGNSSLWDWWQKCRFSPGSQVRIWFSGLQTTLWRIEECEQSPVKWLIGRVFVRPGAASWLPLIKLVLWAIEMRINDQWNTALEITVVIRVIIARLIIAAEGASALKPLIADTAWCVNDRCFISQELGGHSTAGYCQVLLSVLMKWSVDFHGMESVWNVCSLVRPFCYSCC